ncbi:MAG TPA: SprT family zinc-dependent metalloprotease [Caulobacteraceae bacterium]|jgi:hypothetical protein
MIGFRARGLAPGGVVEVAGVPVRLRVDARARRVSLRLDPVRREVVATAPSQRRLADAVAFARERSAWMAGLVARTPLGDPLSPGGFVEVLGRRCRLEAAPVRRGLGLAEGPELVLRAHGEGEAFSRSCVRGLKAHALKVLRERTYAHARALGAPLPEVKVMDARSRWGSCSPAGPGRIAAVRYSWRLVLAPWETMDYVAAHEAAHLVRADHSPAFWAEVARLTPHAKAARAWLREHGPRLQAVGR